MPLIDEACEHCGAPMVIVTTNRGPWKLCPNFDCPAKEQEKEEGAKASGAKASKPAGKAAPKKRKGSAAKAKQPA